MAESMVEQSPTQQAGLMPLLYNKDDAYRGANPVYEHMGQLWATLSDKDTPETYQKTAIKTWKLLKQAAYLLFFSILSLVAICVWIWGISFRSGLQFRQWIEDEKPTVDEIFGAVLKVILWPFEQAFEWANWYVKNYLGWEFQPNSPQPPSVGEAAESSVSSASETLAGS